MYNILFIYIYTWTHFLYIDSDISDALSRQFVRNMWFLWQHDSRHWPYMVKRRQWLQLGASAWNGGWNGEETHGQLVPSLN